VRKDAAAAVRADAEKGYKVIYPSTRVSRLSAGVPDWLEDNGFPEGSVHIAQTRNERKRPGVCFQIGKERDGLLEHATVNALA